MAQLGLIFDEDPERYSRARPGYPPELFEAMGELADLVPGARVLEVGGGTGQATVGMLAVGADLTVVEPGPGLATALRRRLGAGVEVLETTFEAWEPEPERQFDLIAAFTSWHWLDPTARGPLVARSLRAGGALATITTEHVLGGSVELFAEAQGCYERWDENTPSGLHLVPADEVPPGVDEVDASSAFDPGVRRRFVAEIDYSTEEYLDLLQTYSSHRALPAWRLTGLLDCLRELIDGRHGGRVSKRYLYELRVARRLGEPWDGGG